jgi:ribosomal protein L11 methyltransferase
LFSITLNSTSVDRDTLIADIWEAGTVGITESEDWVRAFFDDSADAMKLLDRFGDHDPRLEHVEARDWVAESREQWQPFAVGERFFLVPEWRDDPAPCGRIRLHTHPGMACGTGAHPATQLCLRAMEQHVTDGMSLLDVGTGSGILAEAARLLGADPVIACDIDPEAAAIAKRNLAQSIFNVPVFTGSVRSVRTRAVDAIVANLNLAVLQATHKDILRVIGDEGLLIVAGFREDETQAVADIFKLPVRANYESHDWASLVL